MSDFETTKQMLDRAGIVYTERADLDDAALAIEILEGSGPKNLGYSQFLSIWAFDAAGALIWVGAWE